MNEMQSKFQQGKTHVILQWRSIVDDFPIYAEYVMVC